MDDIPEPLSALAEVERDRVELRIEPAFAPMSPWFGMYAVGWGLLYLPFGLAMFAIALLLAESVLPNALMAYIASGIAAIVAGAAGAAAGIGSLLGTRWLDLSVSAHALRVTTHRHLRERQIDIPLADLEGIAVEGRSLAVATPREEHRFVLPDRSRRSHVALQDWLAQVQRRADALQEAGPEAVPGALIALGQRARE